MIHRPSIVIAARAHFIDPQLVEALITVESGGNQWAWNPEPKYRFMWDLKKRAPFRPLTVAEISSEIPPADFPAIAGDRDQEFWAQQASWGLMQVMGAVAREHGCRLSYLTQLTDVTTNLDYGCQHLAMLLAWASGREMQALAAYNGGKGGNGSPPFRNQAYGDKVLAAKAKLT